MPTALAAKRPLFSISEIGLIVLVASVALTGVYIFVTEASYWSKVLVAALLLVSFAWRYGLFLRVALGVFLALYFTYLKARWEHD
jgi:hypothetical protein